MKTSGSGVLIAFILLSLSVGIGLLAGLAPSIAEVAAGLVIIVVVGIVISSHSPDLTSKFPILLLVVLVAAAPFDLYSGFIPAPVGKVTVADATLAVVLLLSIPTFLIPRTYNNLPFQPVILLVVYCFLSLLVTFSHAGNTYQGVYELRPFLYFSLTLVVSRMSGGPRLTSLLYWVLCAGAFIAAVKAVGIALFFPSLANNEARVTYVSTLTGGAVRVSEGSVWSEAGLLILFPFLLQLRAVTRPFYVVAAGIATFAAIVVTYTRTIWISEIVALVAVLPLAGFRWINGWLRLLVVVGSAVLVASVVAPHELGVVTAGISDRLTAASVTPSLENRNLETDPAMHLFEQSPLLGSGLGTIIARQTVQGVVLQSGFLHNGYLFVLTKLGVVGFLLFLWVLFSGLWRTWQAARRAVDRRSKYMSIGVFAAMAALAVTNVTAPFLVESIEGIALMGLLLGLADRLYVDAFAVVATVQRADATVREGIPA